MCDAKPPASLRREQGLRQALQMAYSSFASLQAVLIVALEQRGGVPLLVLNARRQEILGGKIGYLTVQDPEGNVTYSLIPPEPEIEPDAGPLSEAKPEEPS